MSNKDILKIFSSTQVVAILGAIFGIPAFLWNIFNFFKERRILSVYATIGESSAGFPILVFNMTNMGRRPIILVQIVIQKTKRKTSRNFKSFLIIPPSWPKTLKEAESDNYALEELERLSYILENQYSHIYVYDTLNKKWSVKKRHIKNLISHSREVSKIYHELKGSDYQISRDYDGVIKEYSKVLDIDASDPNIHMSIGSAFACKGLYREAISHFELAFNLGHCDPGGAFYNIALAYAAEDNRDKAIEYLRKAISLKSNIKSDAKKEEYFVKYKIDPEFISIVGEISGQ